MGYQMHHAFAPIAADWVQAKQPSALTTGGGWFFAAGILLFSGSLYLIGLSGIRWPGVSIILEKQRGGLMNNGCAAALNCDTMLESPVWVAGETALDKAPTVNRDVLFGACQ